MSGRWIWMAWLLLALSGSAQAVLETTPASVVGGPVTYWEVRTQCNTLTIGTWKTSIQQVIDSYVAASGGSTPQTTTGVSTMPAQGPVQHSDYVFGSLVCNGTQVWMQARAMIRCNAGATMPGGSYPNYTCAGSTYQCPANQGWQLNGTTCQRESCTAGQLRYNGVCKASCPYPGKTGPRSGQTYEGEGEVGSTLCLDGCTYAVRWRVQVGTEMWGAEAGVSKGVSCSTETVGVDSQGNAIAPAATTTPPPVSAAEQAAKCIAKGQSWGTVNGVVSCSGSSGVTTTKSETTVKETTASEGGPTATETTEKTTTCKDGQCETNTTTTSNAGTGGASTTGTGKTTESQSSFCANNPTDPRCQASKETSDYCETHPDAVGCMSVGTPTEGEAVGSNAAGVSVVTPIALSTNLSCPAPIALPFGAEFEWTPICEVAEMVRPLMLAFAWLGAGLLVVGGLKSGGA